MKTMPTVKYTNAEIIRIGQERYEREIQQSVEADNQGKMLVLDIETGDYEIARDLMDAYDALLRRNPNAVIHLVRVGHSVPVTIGFGGRN